MDIDAHLSIHQTKVSKNSKSTKFSEGFNDIDKKFSEDFIFVKDIAEGSYSKVRLIREKATNNLYALKINKFLQMKNSDYETYGLPKDLLRELAVMHQLDPKFIVKSFNNLYEPL